MTTALRLMTTTIAMVTLVWTCAASAQQRNTRDGVYTQAQVDAGQEVYDQYCAVCHEPKFYRDIWPSWEGKTVENFWFTIIGEMPSDNPGMLYDDEYTNIVAVILQQLGYPAGDTPLDPNNGMANIAIVAP